ncbi:F-box only protein 9 [Eumeta japonica]|uniref:F-box only protein 9 n=1 Tax=Eumeta variegata TaxID=151549 RepID=A0A4C1WNA5_EUMVA|nr:F-box only protein 9 [Eumeta japonica]
MASVAGGPAGGTGGECEGEEQDESSSSNSNPNDSIEINASFNNLNLQSDDAQDALSAFRQQWQRELDLSPQRQLFESKLEQKLLEPDNEEEKAKQLFLRGVELERSGKLYEAVQHYKRAVQLLPDVETRLYHSLDYRSETPEGPNVVVESLLMAVSGPRSALRRRRPFEVLVPQSEIKRLSNMSEQDGITVSEITKEQTEVTEEVASDEDEDSEDMTDLMARFQRILAKKDRLCEMEHLQKGAHISWLPYELILLILRWTVSSELDAVSLERVAATSRGLYVAARDEDLWRALCARTWGLSCGNPKAFGFTTWREMYVERPRLRLHGCYISKTTYLRHGENSFQDQFYRPWYLIEYYRYLRFFPEGVVLMWTTAEEPAACVGQLKHRVVRNNLGIMSGHYRLIGDKVVIIVKKQVADKKPAQTSNTRFRARRKDNAHDQQGQSFHLELQLKSVRSRRNWQLCWRGYAVSARRDVWTSFDLVPGKFPPFAFSRVRHYHAESEAPLS